MYIEIDLAAKTPPFEQIKASIIELIAAGQLPAGHKLPPIRQLAGDLGIAPNTVARAYRELEADGLLHSRGRRGTAVVGLPAEAPKIDEISRAIATAREQGIDASSILKLVSQALAR